MGMGLCPTRASRAREPRYQSICINESAAYTTSAESIHVQEYSSPK